MPRLNRLTGTYAATKAPRSEGSLVSRPQAKQSRQISQRQNRLNLEPALRSEFPEFSGRIASRSRLPLPHQ